MGVIFSLYSSYAVAGKDGINYRAEMLYALYAFSTDFAATSDSVLLSEHRDSDSSMLPRVMGSFANNSMDEWKTKR